MSASMFHSQSKLEAVMIRHNFVHFNMCVHVLFVTHGTNEDGKSNIAFAEGIVNLKIQKS